MTAADGACRVVAEPSIRGRSHDEAGQAAHAAGIAIGDRILAVDDEPASDLAKEAVDELDLPAVVEHLRGEDVVRIELR